MVRSLYVRLAVVVATGLWALAPAQAAKLDEVACGALKAERARLATDALKSDMAKGPEWAKVNLAAGRLQEIEQLIGLDESIAFRCPVPKPIAVPATVAKAGEGGSTGKRAKAGVEDGVPGALLVTPGINDAATKNTLSGAAKKPTAKAVAKPALKPEQNTSAPADRPAAKKPPASTQKSKQKLSDAFVPPPKALGFTGSGQLPAAAGAAPLSP